MLIIAKQSPLWTALLLDPSLVLVGFWGVFSLMYNCFESLTQEVYFVLSLFLTFSFPLLLGNLGMPFYKLQRAKEGAWKAEDLNQTLNQVQLNEPPPTNYMIPEPMFPDLDSSQVGSYSDSQVSWKASHLICALVVQHPPLMAELAFLCA